MKAGCAFFQMCWNLADSYWLFLGTVDILPAVRWLGVGEKPWSPSDTTNPQRVFDLPMGIFGPLISDVLSLIVTATGQDYLIGHAPLLSRAMPGVNNPMHHDIQRADWLTRIHLPLMTNLDCWMQFEDQGQKVHFELGKAYTFNTLKRHAFGNDGDTPRVHLIFEVLRKDP